MSETFFISTEPKPNNNFKEAKKHLSFTQTSDMVPALNKEVLDIQANYKEWIHSETRT